MASSPPAESPVANAAAAAAAAAAPPPPTSATTVVGFQTKKPAKAVAAPPSIAAIPPERLAYLEATLAKLPELDLSEMARVKTCFAAVLGEGRENIVNGLELRVVLGDLGLYPSEEELGLVLRAYRDRVNLVGLARYLRLYKKEFWLNQVAARSRATQQQNPSLPPPQQQPHQPFPAAIATGSAGSGKKPGLSGATPAAAGAGGSAVPHTYTAFSGSHARPGGAAGAGVAGGGCDDDTLRAFVALGGQEDGNGEIAAATLRDAVRGFGLTIDIDAMIRTVDVHHSGMLDYVDFCALWATPADAGATTESMGNALRQASADADHRTSINGSSPAPTSGTNRRLLSVLLTPSHRSSLAGGALSRRSYALASGCDAGTSQPLSPRLGTGNGRPPTSGEQPDDAPNSNNNNHTGVLTMGVSRVPMTATALPSPITEEEHALLVRMFLFPEQFETAAAGLDAAGRRGGARFMLPSRIAQVTSPAHGAGGGQSGTAAGSTTTTTTAAAAAAARRASTSQRNTSQRQLSSRAGRHDVTSGNNASTNSGRTLNPSRRRKAGGKHHTAGDADDDLAADFFSPKNQNVYRPPSPMLLSMRNSTAYRSRVKRLEEQKHAAREDGAGSTYQTSDGLHAATVARDGGAGGYGYGADGDSPSRPAKGATW